MSAPLLELHEVSKSFPARREKLWSAQNRVQAVNGVSLTINKGETLGLVGESGCGKSTLAMLVLGLLQAEAGKIVLDGSDMTHFSAQQWKPFRRRVQMVFQDPYASLHPRMKVGEILDEPFLVHKLGNKKARRESVKELLHMVGLPQEAAGRYPHEFSGGQRQRIGIARALALRPELIIADEPVSALDVSVRGEILNLLMDLQDKLGLSYLFISHDLHVVEHISHRVMVMYLGKVMETFPAQDFAKAHHPYTRALRAAVPSLEGEGKKLTVLGGDVPSPLHLPSGCVFHPRCPYAEERCRKEVPQWQNYATTSGGACHFLNTLPESEK